jgi:hypothetical protein
MGLRQADELQRLRFTGRLAADLEVGLSVDQIRQPIAHERMVVHQQNFNFLRHDFHWDFPFGFLPTTGVGGFRDFLLSS